MDLDRVECITSSDGIDEDVHLLHQYPSKPHSGGGGGGVVAAVISPSTSVHELLECPVCTNSMYPPIHQHTSFGLNSMERHGNKRTKTIFDFFKSSGEASKVGNLSPSVVEASSREETRPLESPTREVYVDCNSLERDPGLRTPIRQYSPHRNSVQSVENLSNVTRHIDRVINAQTSEDVQKNRLRLKVTSEAVRWLSLQGCAVRGHRESSTSENRGNLIEMLKLMDRLNVNIEDVILDNASGNAKYTSPNIQKEILHIMANMVRKKIREEIGDKKFCLLVDEANDAGGKEEMAIVLRFVDGQGSIKERFFDIVEVENTAASTLKKSVCNSLARYNLLIDDLRGQGYDGASNMRGAWNGLQALFLKDCPYAYYVHCFAHRLQLALVAASKKEPSIWLLFSKLSSIVNLIGSSPKRLTELQVFQAVEIARKVASGERETGKGANQIGSLQRAGETRWSSHFDFICNVIDMYWATMQVLKKMVSDGSTDDIRGEAKGVLMMMETFDFVFMLHVVHRIMGITDMLCRNLQEKTLDIQNAIDSIATTKVLLLKLRNESFDHLLMCVNSICIEYEIETPDMNVWYNEGTGRSCQQKNLVTVEHHYHFDMFNSVIDYQLEELNYRFNDDALEILKLSCALQPNDQFKLFDVDQICLLARKFYPADFSDQEMHHLRCQLEHYEVDILHHKCFQNLSSTFELLQILIRTNKSHHYNLVERLIRLILTLPVSAASTERAFSAMKRIKTDLRNRMEEDFLTDTMIIHIEREFAQNIDIDEVIDEFDSLKQRRAQLK